MALFPKAEVSLPGGKTLTITATDPGPMYDDIRLNGKRLDGGFLDVTELRGGAKLQFK